MAKPTDAKDEKNPNNAQPMELNQNLLIIINNIILIVVIIISMSALYFSINSSLDKKLTKIMPEAEQTEEDEETEQPQEGLILDLGDFTLNLADTTKKGYLKVGVTVELSKTQEEIEAKDVVAKSSGGHGEAPAVDPNAEIMAEMERYKAAIRDAVISVLSNKTSEELSSPTGKELAKEEISEMINNIFAGNREVMRVSFGQFIIQFM